MWAINCTTCGAFNGMMEHRPEARYTTYVIQLLDALEPRPKDQDGHLRYGVPTRLRRGKQHRKAQADDDGYPLHFIRAQTIWLHCAECNTGQLVEASVPC